MKIITSFLLILLSFPLFSQVEADIGIFRDKDTTASENIYYTDQTDKLLLKFTNSIKYTKLDITNKNTNETLKLIPASSLDLGFAFNYKWLGLGFTVGIPTGAAQDSTKGKTSSFDVQLSMYSKKFVVDATYQKYKGFHVGNPAEFNAVDSLRPDVFPQLPNMENYSLGASAFWVLNHKKFSYRAAYVRNVIQKKSAGSLLFGPYFSLDAAQSRNGFVPETMPQEVRDTFAISQFSSMSYGVSVGYTYSVVIVKKIFMNFSIVPGIGVKNIQTELNGVSRDSKAGVAGRLSYRFAMGYEHRWFLLGLTLNGSQVNMAVDNFDFSPGAGILKLFVGKRFDLSQKDKFKKKTKVSEADKNPK